MKPWEETWRAERSQIWSNGDPCGNDPVGVFSDPDYAGKRSVDATRAQLAAQSPAMARALLKVEWIYLEEFNTMVCPWCTCPKADGHASECTRETVLRAAGVIP